MYVTIDPGISTGWSVWSLDGRLLHAGLGDPRPTAPCPDDVWIETPVIYPRSKARPNDIIKLARDAGRWGGVYEASKARIHFVTPAEWKGQVPKDVHHARVWAVLRGSEQELVNRAVKGIAPSKRHNILDAVALGVWVRDRAGRHG